MVKIGWTIMNKRNKRQEAGSKEDKNKNKFFISHFFYSLFLYFLFLYLFASIQIIYACPACNDLVTFGKNAAQAMRFGNGIAWSMLLMFSAPVLMMGALVWFVVRAERKRLKLERGEKV